MDDLFHLHRGGRLSKTAAIVGTMINLKPVLHVDDEGHLVMLSKVRGRKKSLIGLVDCMEKQLGDWKDKNDIIFISHGDCPEDAQFVADLIKERLDMKFHDRIYRCHDRRAFRSGYGCTVLYGGPPLTSVSATCFTPYI